uniref:Uncharacterized protein n=1 Tax=Oryza punctata TaxID=4537 RepID=A0A0E0MHD7_ORYPU
MGFSLCYCIAVFSERPEAKLNSRATFVQQSCCLPKQILLWFLLFERVREDAGYARSSPLYEMQSSVTCESHAFERQQDHQVVMMGVSPCYCIVVFSARPKTKLKSGATYVRQSYCLPNQILLWFLLFVWIDLNVDSCIKFSYHHANLCSSKKLVAESPRGCWLCTVFSIIRNAVLSNVRIARIERQQNHQVIMMGISLRYCIAVFSARPEAKLNSRATFVQQSCCLPN